MEKFNYRALTPKGRQIRGVVAALNENDLYTQLQKSGLEVIDFSKVNEKRRGLALLMPNQKVKLRELIQLFANLEQMNTAGVPLLDVIADVRDASENIMLRDVLTDLHRTISEGASFSDAMANHPRVFSPLYISMIRSGEETGDLSLALRNLIAYITWVDAIQAKIKKATQYPLIVSVVVLLAITVMMGFVVPQIIGFIKTMDQEIPFYTKALISTSEFFTSYWWLVLIMPFVTYGVLKFFRKSSYQFAYVFDAFLLKIPTIGPVIRKINIARFCQTFAALFTAGVDILKCLRSARETIGNVAIAEALEFVQEKVQNGSPLSEAFSLSGEFPLLVVRMLKIGEESGNLSPVLLQISDYYDKETDESIQGLVLMIEPMLTAFLGFMIAWIAAGVFGPIYESFQNLNI